MANDPPRAQPTKFWKMTADGFAPKLFFECTLPSMTLTASDFKVWDEQSKPNPLPVGVQPSFGDVTLQRIIDENAECYQWASRVAQKQANADTVKDVTLTACGPEGDALFSWVLKGA